jgi:hypothetical protein
LLAVGDQTLWVTDLSSDPGLHAIEIDTGRLLHSFGPEGEGPGEFSGPPFGLKVLARDPAAVWAWDPGLSRLTRFEPHPIPEFELVSIALEAPIAVTRLAWVAPDRIIGVSPSDEFRFSFFSGDGQHQQVVPGDLLGSEDLPVRERLRATDSGIFVCTWPEKGFAITNKNLGRIEFFSDEAALVRLAEVPFPSEPIFEPSDRGEIRFRSPREHYIGCTATQDFLFALFSGRLDGEYEGEARFSAEFVHVFGWDGRLRVVFRLDRDIHQIATNPEGTVLFGASLVDAGIYRFEIPATPGG